MHSALMVKNKISTVCLLLSAIAVAACGSSGGNQTPPPPAPPLVVVAPDPDGPDPLSFPDEPGLTPAQESERNSFAGSTEFANQWSLAEIGADYAYARGYSGQGVTVGIIDTGVDPNHSAFSGKLHSSSGVASQSCPGGACSFGPIRDTGSHGTAVSGILAAARNGGRMHGVAYNAQLLALGIQLGTAPPVYRPVDLINPASFRSLDEQGQGLYRRIGSATRIINHSFGYEGVVTDYTAAEYRAAFGRTVDSLIQAGTPDSEKTILVWAAGNSNGRRDANGNLADASSPNLTAATPHYFPELRGHFITVVATGSNGDITSYSNRCGVAADYCIAAPGSGIYGPAAGSTDSYGNWAGTSLATPQVTGALALMEEAFRGQLGSTEMVSRLFAAADKSGIYADQDIYGQGLLDVEKATRPIGAMSASLGHSLDEPAVVLQRTTIAAGPSWGDALQRGLAGRELAVFDSLNAPFFIPMEGFNAHWPLDDAYRADRQFARFVERTSETGPGAAALSGGWTVSSAEGLARALYDRENAQQFWDPPAQLRNAWVALGTPGVGVARDLLRLGDRGTLRSGLFLQNPGVARGERLAAPGRAQGAFLNLDLGGGAQRLFAEFGLLSESERLLGAGAEGAYGRFAGRTWFSRFLVERDIAKGLRLIAVAQAGHTSGEAGRGLFRETRGVLSSAYSAGLEWGGRREGKHERAWLMASQPLRNESGGLELDYPIGRTRAGAVLRETAWLGVEPSGRQIDLTMGYETTLHPNVSGTPAWRIRAEFWRSLQPGHRAAARPENTLFLALSRQF
ncbi:MAG: S8 family serine peptidase [Gammaproteobacteria bacterium]|nr:S8 family serine peptidase [Gammaproteobacteria bacterium]MYD01835.1 S8 family serine peptidase [Gammaproteobacteria bacterium]MYI26044.1 S8 family serine peptidase [Gammaproteobacteria bacterium]